MKVIEQTATRLTLQHRPVPVWATGLMLVVGCVGFLVYLVGCQTVSLHLTCKRLAPTQTSCELKQMTWIGMTQTQKLYNPSGASVIRRSGGQGGPTYQVVISTEVAQISLLSNADGGYPGQQTIANQINHFVSNPGQTTVSVDQHNRIMTNYLSLMGMAGLISGILMLSLNSMVTCTFYKSLKKVVLERKNWFGVRSTIERPLNTILTIEIEEKRIKNRNLYRAVLMFHAAERLPINQDYTSEQAVRATVRSIQLFLNTATNL